MSYKIHIKDSKYSEWEIYDLITNDLTKLDINPIEKKILSGDIIDTYGNILSSSIGNAKNLAGILILKGKTYGRAKNGIGKFYYKCIPNDKRLPAFLIPYENKQTGFSKVVTNKYILFKYNNWDSKHPIGTLNNIIGDVTNLTAFYEYQLHCKDLVKPFKQFINAVNKANKEYGTNIYNKLLISNPNIIDRRNEYIISIDSAGSTDLDDAFSLKGDVISVYVANVPIILDYFSERISTIYLPDRKCPMLPALLSENLCSLLENEERLAFCIDIKINDGNIVDIEYKNTLIKVAKNYIYNEEKLNSDSIYKSIFDIIVRLNKKCKYIREIVDSHHVVAYLMLLMNVKCADKLQEFKTGIYRSINLKENNITQPNNIPSDIYDFIKIWQTSSGQYTNFKENIGHQLINSGLDSYIHITSPIRRLVDLLNMLKLQEKLKLLNNSERSLEFYNYWENQLEYINTTMRAIRKIQTDCNMLNICVSNSSMLDTIYNGYIFDKIDRPHKLYQYTVYIPEIKMFSRVKIKQQFVNYTCCKFKLYLIQDGVTLKRKIRLEIIND
jgi:hypothetical protein